MTVAHPTTADGGHSMFSGKAVIDPNVNSKFIVEGVDHYRNLFSFTQRKVEYENYRFKYPSLLAVVIESINTKIIDN
jgi:hypothetical protein